MNSRDRYSKASKTSRLSENVQPKRRKVSSTFHLPPISPFASKQVLKKRNTLTLPNVNEVAPEKEVTKYLSILRRMPDVSNLRNIIDKMKKIKVFKFVYLAYVVPKQSIHYSHFCLKVVPYKNVDKSNMMTLSPYGITHYTNIQTFTTFEKWEYEYNKFCEIRELKFFKVFRMWKAFHLWKKTIVFKKYTKNRNKIIKNCFSSQKLFGHCLLQLQEKSWEIYHHNFTKLDIHEDTPLYYFIENQVEELEVVKRVLNNYNLFMMQSLKDIISRAVKKNNVDINNPKRSRFYIERTQKRNFLSRIRCFLKLFDYMTITMLHGLLKRSHIKMTDMLKIHFRYTASQDALSKISFDTLLETLPRPETTCRWPLFQVELDLSEDVLPLFDPTPIIFNDEFRRIFKRWNDAINSIKRFQLEPDFEIYYAEEPRSNEYRRQLWNVLTFTLKLDKDLQEDIVFLDEFVDIGFRNIYLLLEKFEAMWLLYKEDLTMTLEQLQLEYDLNTLKDLCVRYNTETKSNDNIFPYQAMGLFFLKLVPMKAKIIQTPTYLFSLLSQHMSDIGAKKVKELIESCDRVTEELNFIPDTCEEIVEFTTMLDEIELTVEKLEEEQEYVRELYNMLDEYGISIPKDELNDYLGLNRVLGKLRLHIDEVLKTRENLVTKFESKINKEIIILLTSLASILEDSKKPWLVDIESDPQDVLNALEQMYEAFSECNERYKQIQNWQRAFKLNVTRLDIVAEIITEIQIRQLLWRSHLDWATFIESLYQTNFYDLDLDEVQTTVANYGKNYHKLERAFPENGIVEKLRDDVEIMKEKLATITYLKNPALKQRHWLQIEAILNTRFTVDVVVTLELLEELGVFEHEEKFMEIAGLASSEESLEAMLKKVEDIWKIIELPVLPYKDNVDIFMLGSLEEVQAAIDESMMHISIILSSRHCGSIKSRVEEWERLLNVFSKTLNEWFQCMQTWMYLEVLFSSPDIQRQLPTEAKLFTQVDKSWKEIMRKVAKVPLAIAAASDKTLLETFENNNKLLDRIMKCLEAYLTIKRLAFPRFFFLSNDELLEILAQTRNPHAVQPHLRKCFDAIAKLEFAAEPKAEDANPDEEEKTELSAYIIAMISPENERVSFGKGLKARGNVEEWLKKVEENMFSAIRKCMKYSLTDYLKKPRTEWIRLHPSQVVLTASQIMWAQKVHEILDLKDPAKIHTKMAEFENACISDLNDCAGLSRRDDISGLFRKVLCALMTIDIHARDTITSMTENYVTGPESFEWLKMIRYYWDEPLDTCVVRMSSSSAFYGYEYIGAGGVLVITPLTDRCYLCLMGAIQLNLGGAPAGPAGTGKTETTKDLAKSLAIQCVVFNCSEGLDYKMMGRFFSGLASSGAWCCFDEFNRINIEVLSVIAQQLITIRNAKLAKKKRFVFEGLEIQLIPTCAVFITMNPGYAGRTELPDNLKSLFRPISMMVPDYSLIAEVILYSEGFESSRNLAKKMVQMYKLSSEQLSKQDHYDFGMRAVKSVLVMAGALKRASPDQPDEVTLLCALRDSNLPKFLAEDVILFAAILGDLFPGVELPFRDYSVMQNVITFILLRNKMQVEPTQINKVIQLYETMVVRWGVMLVGPAGGGKTTVLTTLGESFDELYKMGNPNPYFKPVRKYVMNPKSLTMEELYGGVNPLTLEWRDGLLAISLRVAVQCLEDDHQWIVCDGPVDAVWIENMNTVLDDNKMLCLANSERIKLTPYVHMVFEVGDLAQASPATVSRCGMVYVDPSELRWKPYVMSWLEGLPESKLTSQEIKNLLIELLDNIDPGFTFIKRNCIADIGQVDISKAAMLCTILESLLMLPVDPFDDKLEQTVYITKIFIFSYMWAVGGNLSDDSKVKFQLFVAKQFVDENGDLVLPSNLWDSYINNKTKEFEFWQKIIPDFIYQENEPFFEIVVPTKDTVRYGYVMEILMKLDRPVLFVGNTGVGKSVIARYILNKLQASGTYLPFVMNFSAQTDSGKTQEMFESRLERRKKTILGAPWGKKVIIFIDDVNMPKLDVYGSQPTIELLRQYLDFGGLYDRELMFWKNIKDVVMCAACAPPGGGRNPLTPRFVRHFAMLYITNPSEDTQRAIFQSILKGHFTEFIPEVRVLADQIINAAVDVYAKVLSRLLPTPAKSHYLFNLRDLSKCIQGVLQSDAGSIKEPMQVLRLFYHECTRTFHDRLISIEDRSLFFHMMQEVCNKHFGHPIIEFEQTPILTRPPLILFGDFLNYGVAKENRIYEEIKNLDGMKEILGFYLTEYNTTARYEMKLVLFTDAAEHVVRIARVLRAERGHALLLGPGGSGRRSLAMLAAYINEYKCFGMEITRDYDINSFHDDLRNLFINTGVKEEDTVFLFTDSQILQEQFLEDVNNMLNSGEVPNLFGGEDLEKVFIACRGAAAEAGYNASDKESVYVYFINKVRTKLHLCICMSPVGDVFRRRCRMFPSLVNCCAIDWFEKWPPDALYNVAVQLIDAKGNDELADKLSQVCVLMHESVDLCTVRLLKELNRYFYTTPSSYLDLLRLYSELLNKKIQEILGKQARLNNGLGKLYETYDVVGVMEQQIKDMKPVLVAKTAEAKYMMNQVMLEEKEIGVVREAVMKDEADALVQAAATQELADDAARDLAEVMPAMEAAQDALKSLNKADINELRVFQKPPEMVKFVMEPVCLLLGAKTDWDSAKKVLGDSNFLKKLQEYDKDHIKEAMLKKIKVYIDNKNFDPDIVAKVSKVCRSMCLWVKAIQYYAIIFRDVEPKIIKQKEAEETLKGVMKLLKQKKDELAAVEAKLELAQNTLKKIIDETAQLQSQLDLAEARLNRAEKLTQALSDEQIRWEASMKSLGKELEYATGNIIVAAGCVAYLGAFPSSYRGELVDLWVEKCKNLNILISSTYNTVAILADSFTVREWNGAGLPRDAVSIENGIYVTKARRFPLMIDPQEQANRWIRNMERDNTLQIVKFRDSNYMKILENCIRLGRPALIEDIGENLDPNLTPILQKCTFVQGGRLLIRLGDTDIEYDPHFKVYLTTKLANPHYLPDVCILVTIVNFTVTLLGLEDQLLADVVKLERPDLEQQRSELITQINKDTMQLLAIEDKILRMLYTSQGNILDDEELIETLNEGKETASVIGARLIETEAAEKDMTLAREKYRPIATRGAVLYFVVATLSTIDSMYQYSLKYFQQIFNNVIETATKIDVFEQYIVSLMQAITLAVYQNISRGLFEKDKLVYSFLILTGIYRYESKISESYWSFLLRGPVGSKVQLGKKPPIPSLTDGTWLAAHHLDDVFPSFKGLRHDCLNQITIKIGDFVQVIDISDEQVGSIIDWDSRLDLFEKLVLLKALKSEVLVDAITQYISVLFGKEFIESPVVSLNSLYLDTSNRTPLIFVLSRGYDPFGAFQKFAMEIGYGDRIQSISLGQGQGPIAEKLIFSAIIKGDWVFLQNCHLAASWMTALEEIVQKICTDTEPPNETFRLFMSTMPAKEFPVSVLQNSVKVTKEPPKGLKANMKRAFQEMDVDFFEKHSLGLSWRSMIFGMCMFHGIIQERKKFGPLGWTIIYEFNDNDRECGLLTLEIFCKNDVILWDALEYITGEITYGGRVTDMWDLRCLKTILYKFFAPHTLKEGYVYSSSGVYYCPKLTSIGEFQNYIEELPIVDEPEVFGMHDNANIAFQNEEVSQFLGNLIRSQTVQSSDAEGETPVQIVWRLSDEIKKEVPKKIDLDFIHPALLEKDSMGRAYSNTTVLLHEIQRYNKFLSYMHDSLTDLQKAIKGVIVMSDDLENVFSSFMNNEVPSIWSAKSYNSMLKLGSWVHDLILRIDYMDHWMRHQQSPSSWISGLFFPQGLLTASLQAFSRKYSVSINQLIFDFAPQPAFVMQDDVYNNHMSGSTADVFHGLKKPNDGIFVHGLYIDAGRWDIPSMKLVDALPGERNAPLPVFWLFPVTSITQPDLRYVAPLYKTPARAGVLSTTGHSTNFVIPFLLATNEDQSYWILRGTALITQVTE